MEAAVRPSPSLPPSVLTHDCLSLFASCSVSAEFVVQRSASHSGLIPRAPTGSEWSRSNKDKDDGTSVCLSEILKDLDRQAGYVCVIRQPVHASCAIVLI